MNHVHLLLFLAAGLTWAAAGLGLAGRRRAALGLHMLGLAVQTAYLVARAWLPGFFLASSVFDPPNLILWALSLAALLVGSRERGRAAWRAALVLAGLLYALVLLCPPGFIPPTPNKLTAWAYVFFLTESAGIACFLLAGLWAWLRLRGKTGEDWATPAVA